MIDEAARKRRHRNERILATSAIIVLITVVAIFVRWNQREEEELRRSKTYVPKTAHVSAEALLLRDYVRIDTSNPPGTNQIAGARWLAERLRAGGVAAELIESGPGRANLYARIRGRGRADGLMLLHHIDVVAANPAEWEVAPFSGDVRLNMLHGRGALDMKGIAICHLAAFLDVAKSRRVPERDLVFLATVDEERGSELGVPWLLANRPDVFNGIRYVLNEGGINEVQAEAMSYFGIEIGTRSMTVLEIEAPRREQLEEMRIALEPHFISREPERVLPEVRRFFRELAPTRLQFGAALADIDKTIAKGEFWRLPRGYRELTQNQLWVDAPYASGDHFAVVTRIIDMPGENPDPRIAWLGRTIAPFGARVSKILRKAPTAPLTPTDTPMFALLVEEAHREYACAAGTEILHGQLNDSRFLRAQGIACYGVWPFPVDVFQSQSIHNANERVRLDWFDQGVKLMRRVVWRWAFAEEPAAVH